MRIGVIACETIRRELDLLIAGDPDITEVVHLPSALHMAPETMRTRLIEEIEAMGPRVDVVLLGYGRCRSLLGIEEAVGVPVVKPQSHDCLAMLMTPERYDEERSKEPGTWFMTPGWADIGADMVIRELHLDGAAAYGRDPMDLARRLFSSYTRGLYIETGVGDEASRQRARTFCEQFGLRYEETSADSPVLAEALRRAKGLAGR